MLLSLLNQIPPCIIKSVIINAFAKEFIELTFTLKLHYLVESMNLLSNN